MKVQVRENYPQRRYKMVLDTVLINYENSELNWQNALTGWYKVWLSKAILRKLGLV